MTDSSCRIEAICETVHEALRAWAKANGQAPQPAWADAPDWMKDSTLDSVQKVLLEPDQSPGRQHESWLEHKLGQGWRFGPEKDETSKTHPMLIPFEDLPETEKKKDALLIAVVRALMPIQP